MRRPGTTLLTVLLLAGAGSAEAQGVAELFGKVASTVVVVVRAKDAGVDGQGRVSDVGSGVVVPSDGKIMTAAHLVQGAEGIGVQFLGGRTVGARVVASESLIQLDQSRTSRSRPRPIWPGFASARAGSPVRLR